MKKIHKAAVAVSGVLFAALLGSCIFLPEKEATLEFSKNRTRVTIGSNSYSLVWSDEFEGNALDTDNWNRVTWAAKHVNNEVQSYSANTSYSVVADGTLKLIAKGSGQSWTSARIDTSNKQTFKYGYIEARIKLPVAYTKSSGADAESEANLLTDVDGNPVNNGVWPAFWMMPNPTEEDSNGAYGVWPRSGEIDIMEYSPSTSGQTAYATLHHALSEIDATDTYPSLGRISVEVPTYENDGDWHTFGMLWTSGTLEAFYDGKSLGAVYANAGTSWAQWPYDQEFYIILNLAMGGNLGGAIDSKMKMAVYEIDYVRVYQ